MENLLKTHDAAKRLEIVNDVRKKFEMSRDYYESKFALFRVLYKEYRAQRDDADLAEWSIKVALAYGLVENIVSRIAQTMLGRLPIEVKAKRDEDQTKAEKFTTMCRTYFGSPEYRLDYTTATRERVICGTAWEFDEWVSEYEDGFRWAISTTEKMAQMDIPVVSSIAKIARKVAFKGYKLVKHRFPVKVGYRTRFPSIFNVFPQPGIIRVPDLKWTIERVEYRSIEDLRKCTYIDDSGASVPVYDLSEIDALLNRGISIKPSFPSDNTSVENFRKELEGGTTATGSEKDDGIPAGQLLILRSSREQIVILNGAYCIQHVKDIYHKPGLKVRARYYTPSNHSIFGIGAIEPVLDSINEFSDVHSLAMQDWFRSVNQMLAYDETAFPYPEDFDSRGGGQLRAASGVDLSRAIMPIAKQDKIGSMLTAQSGIQGVIENIVSVAEMTPGVMGTRPYHNTATGLMEVSQNMSRRFGLTMNCDQCETMRQMDEMYWIFEQFMFDAMPFKQFGNGFGAVSYKREDIDTDGEGFLYVASDDPSYGDTQAQRNMALVLLQQAMNYAAAQAKHPEWDRCDVGEIFRWVLDTFGKGESEKILVPADGSTSPEEEYQLMMQGAPVETHPKDNVAWHIAKHVLQQQALERAGKASSAPELLVSLVNHIEAHRRDMMAILNNPAGFAEQFSREEAMKSMASSKPAPQLNMGQNLPSNQGVPPMPEVANV